MNDKRPVLLVTNDDGVEAEGIIALTKALRSLGTIVVFAPDGHRSGTSRAITCLEPVRYRMLRKEEGLTVYSCTGTPVDCVKLALNEVLPVMPDLLVSGINHGGNEALAVNYSGTMGAAFEGCVFDIPSIGVSLCDYSPGDDFSTTCTLLRKLAGQVLKHGLPRGVYLNLNVPNVPDVKGMAVGRQTAGKWVNEYIHEKSDQITQYWLSGDYQIHGPICPDNDIILLKEGYATVVPCKVDVTDYAFMDELKKLITEFTA